MSFCETIIVLFYLAFMELHIFCYGTLAAANPSACKKHNLALCAFQSNISWFSSLHAYFTVNDESYEAGGEAVR